MTCLYTFSFVFNDSTWPPQAASAILNCWCQQLLLIPWYCICQAEGGWESRAVAAAAASRQMSGVTMASEARMGALTTDDGQLLITVSHYRRWHAVWLCTAT